MTDLSLNEFFGKSPSFGMESAYFDGRHRTNGYLVYFKQGNAPWMKSVDAKIDPLDHGAVYLWPHSAVLRELARTERLFFEDDSSALVSYSVGTSAGGSREGANGHVRNLMLVERFCQAVMQRSGGKVQITLMSDHGHNLVDSDYFPLHKKLERMGYRDRRSLSGINDIVVPRFGPITCAGVYTRSPQRVAHDVIRLEEIELSCYRENNAVVVLGKHGQARITRQGRRFRYDCDSGDPLELLPALERLRARGLLDDEGYADDSVLFEETCHLPYPDPLHRLWRAFDGLMRHPPDVLVSIRDGSCYGTSFFNLWVRMKSAHGNLRLPGSSGFVMTTAAQLPDVLRMEDLAEQLRAVGWEDVRAHGDVH